MQPATHTSTDRRAVWIVEDHQEFRSSVQELVNGTDDLVCPHAFGSAEAILAHLAHDFAPEVILVDIGLPGMDGIELVRRIHGFSPATELVIVTVHEDNDRIFQGICAGAHGYIVKEAGADVLWAIREVLRGGVPLSPAVARRILNFFPQLLRPRADYQLTRREREVLSLVAESKGKKQIAVLLGISQHTVDTHLRSIYAKLHVRSRVSAAVKAREERLV